MSLFLHNYTGCKRLGLIGNKINHEPDLGDGEISWNQQLEMRTNNIQHNTLVFWNSCSQAIDQVCCETWMWSERVLPFVCQKISTDHGSSMSCLVLEYIDMYWCWSWLKSTCSTWLYNIIYNWTLSHVIDVERNNSTFHIDWTYCMVIELFQNCLSSLNQLKPCFFEMSIGTSSESVVQLTDTHTHKKKIQLSTY